MRESYNIPEDLLERYPDAGVYEFWQSGKVAPLVVTKDLSVLKLGALVVYEVGVDFSCGTVVDRRGKFVILNDLWKGEGLAQVPERALLGISVGLITSSGVVTDDIR